MENTKSGQSRRRGLSKELLIPIVIFAAICVYVYILKRKLIPDFARDHAESDSQEK